LIVTADPVASAAHLGVISSTAVLVPGLYNNRVRCEKPIFSRLQFGIEEVFMRVLTHPGRHEIKKLRALPSGTAFLMVLAALLTIFLLLFISVEAR